MSTLLKMRLIFVIFLFSFMGLSHLRAAENFGPKLTSILESISSNEEIPVVITLSGKVDLEDFRNTNTIQRRAELIRALRGKAESSQNSLKSFLKSRNVQNFTSLWLINGISAKLSVDLIRKIKGYRYVESIELDYPLNVPIDYHKIAVNEVGQWNIDVVCAPQLWDLGYTGQGVVVANMDSGVEINHPDLVGKWRGGDNSWFDPYSQHATPTDLLGHGTQTMGVIVGGSVDGTTIGMAPDAKWIAVKIFNDDNQAFVSGIHAGFQWLLDPDGNPNTDDAPDIVNNSWGYVGYADECILEFQNDIQILKAAGIAVVFSAGNEGPASSTSVSPANYPESFAVGAGGVDPNNIYEILSSRGPSSCDDTIYPEVVAPGFDIYTTDISRNGEPPGYIYIGGTSIAAPHVSGAMALLLSAFPILSVLELGSVLKESAIDIGTPGPDNTYGCGLINIFEAYKLLFNSCCFGDMNNDGSVDYYDLLEYSTYFLRVDCVPGSFCEGDFSGDDRVDLTDFAILANDWFRTDCPDWN